MPMGILQNEIELNFDQIETPLKTSLVCVALIMLIALNDSLICN